MTSLPAGGVPVRLTWRQVFPSSNRDDTYLEIGQTLAPVTFFVGRNGTGKSRTAAALVRGFGEAGHHLSTDRLIGVMKINSYEFGAIPAEYRGVPVETADDAWNRSQSRIWGTATEDLYALREQPDITLRVAAFIRRALGRAIEMRESAGFLDPVVRTGGVEYSLFRDEGHGLRELVVLLTAAYRSDWQMLVVDEPELHLHPSLVRLWITELSRECTASGRHAVVVTHEPTLLRPKLCSDLDSVILFRPNLAPIKVSDAVMPVQEARVTASLAENPSLIGLLAFSPRPVLVEGPSDVAALTVALRRTAPSEVVSQTDFVECGGSGAVSMWLEIARRLSLDVRAVADLDAFFASEVQRVMDADSGVRASYEREFYVANPRTNLILKDLIAEADKSGIEPNPKDRSKWLARVGGVHGAKRDALLRIWGEAGLWLHPQGTLEEVLGLTENEKSVANARVAAERVGSIDRVAEWSAYELDMAGDLLLLLNVAVETVAHRIMEGQRSMPGVKFDEPVGGAPGIERLVSVEPVGHESHRITVLVPPQFAGYSLVFSRDTPSSDLQLQEPSVDGGVGADDADGAGVPQSSAGTDEAGAQPRS